MATYVKQYIERVTDVPTYLRRHLALIKDLDEQVARVQQELEHHSRRQLLKAVKGDTVKTEQEEDYDVSQQLTKLLGLAEEKVRIAAQIYQFIDDHIQHLDDDLAALSKEMEADRSTLGLKETACSVLGIDLAAKQAGDGDKRKKKGKRKQADLEEEEAAAEPIVESVEPLYCICHGPSNGQMVACDNEDCEIEWFHFECVGLKTQPAGEWFCPSCIKKLKKDKDKGKGK